MLKCCKSRSDVVCCEAFLATAANVLKWPFWSSHSTTIDLAIFATWYYYIILYCVFNILFAPTKRASAIRLCKNGGNSNKITRESVENDAKRIYTISHKCMIICHFFIHVSYLCNIRFNDSPIEFELCSANLRQNGQKSPSSTVNRRDNGWSTFIHFLWKFSYTWKISNSLFPLIIPFIFTSFLSLFPYPPRKNIYKEIKAFSKIVNVDYENRLA